MNNNFKEIYDNSIKNPENFWQEISNDIFWFKKPTKILNKSNPPFYKWFEDGITNTCYNALDVHIDQGRGDKLALIYDSPITGNKKQFTYKIDGNLDMVLHDKNKIVLQASNEDFAFSLSGFGTDSEEKILIHHEYRGI